MCCIFSDEPIEDARGRYKTRINGANKFQTNMCEAPCVDCPESCLWFCCQFNPYTCCCTQYYLRYKVLGGDMTKYTCCQGYANCCGCKSGEMGEKDCPEFCLCLEAGCCNGFAVSASRLYVMDKYDLQSDPCDYRLIRFSNCMQLLACICDIAAIFDGSFRELARIIDHIADIVYHAITGCMTAQVAYELKYQTLHANNPATSASKQADATYYPPTPATQALPQQQVIYTQQPIYQQQPQQVIYQQQPYAQQPQYAQQPVYAQPQQQVVYVQQQPYGQQPQYAQQPIYGQPQPQVVYAQQQ